MNITHQEVSIRELSAGYRDNNEDGIVGFDGKLDIRPPYQREFIYKDKQRAAVINTVMKGFALNVMYWAVREDGDFEIIDGQQRTISICQFVAGDFSFEGRYYHNMQDDEQQQILNYKVTVYLCSGTDSEKLGWFRTINIAGEKLAEQELRNAVYAGPWLASAKRHFSRTGCAAYNIGSAYMSGTPIRQDYLKTTIEWISGGVGDDAINGYMATHHHDLNANDLWLYYQGVIAWVKANFPVYRKEMKGLPWGPLYNEFKASPLDPKKLEAEVSRLMEDEDVTSKKGIYPYVLSRKEKTLNIRAFSPNMKREAYERQAGVCPVCKEHFDIEGMEGDHIVSWHSGGKTRADNCQMLCVKDNREKAGK